MPCSWGQGKVFDSNHVTPTLLHNDGLMLVFSQAGLDFSRHKKEGIDPGTMGKLGVLSQNVPSTALKLIECNSASFGSSFQGILGGKLANSSLVGQRAPSWVTFAGL